MTPPTLDPRTKPTMVRWTPTEIATVSERAQACGLTVARFVREAALGAVPKATRNVDQKALVRELARSGRRNGSTSRSQTSRPPADGAIRRLF